MTTDSKHIIPVDISETMRSAYLEYAMSIIIGRALPDVRDGLKPVHRRILFAMNNLNLTAGRAFSKSAKVVGDVIGKYHPHGDASIYEALVRMAQDFSMRYKLVDGQGNFGSIDGDAAAAMRYTEVRLQKITAHLLEDIDKNTVDFQPNYDNSLDEPLVFPTKLPSLLMNGSSGIAVGMATNIPPHNLGELISGIIYLIDNRKNHTFEGLLKHVPGPDFPTAGVIIGRKGITDAYKTGRGIIKIRGKTHTEEVNRHAAVIITELPYNVNKAKLVEKIAELVADKKLLAHDIRDESDRTGIRIVIELKKGEIPEVVIRNLYINTQLQTSFGINMLAMINKQPKVLNLASVLLHFIDHRVDVITRRTRFDLRKSSDRIHIVEGLLLALADIDKIVALLKSSADAKAAKAGLMKEFSLSELQSQAILDMRLQRLTGLEQVKLNKEKADLTKLIAEFRSILDNPDKLQSIIKKELKAMKDSFSDKRLTEIIDDEAEITTKDLIAPEESVVTLTRSGYIKRTSLNEYRQQKRGGRGKIGMGIKSEEDIVNQILMAITHDTILLFSNFGKVYWKYIYELPELSRTAKGRSLVNIVQLMPGEKIISMAKIMDNTVDLEELSLLMVTKNGIFKKTALSEFQTRRTSGARAIRLDADDSLVKVCLTDRQGEDQLVFIATRFGQLNLFNPKSVKNLQRPARGVIGIRFKSKTNKKDYVVAMELVKKKDDILTVSENGFGKRTKLSKYKIGNRGNMGNLNMRVTAKTGPVAGVLSCLDSDEILLLSAKGNIIRMTAKGISRIGRITQGVKLINLEEADSLAGVCKISPLITDN